MTFIEIPEHWVSDDQTLQDPYEQDILIVMDENGDGNVAISISHPVSYATVVTNKSVAAISFGPEPENRKLWLLSWMR